MIEADFIDDLELLINTPAQAESLLLSLEQPARGIGLSVKAFTREYIHCKQKEAVSTLRGKPLKFVDQFTYLGSKILSTESDDNIRPAKACIVIDSQLII